MTRLLVDPSTLQCPDYSGAEHAGARGVLTAAGITEAQAIEALKAIWTRQNVSDKAAWQQQINDDKAAKEEELRKATEAEATRCNAEEAEKDELLKEEKKKYREKYLPVMVSLPGPKVEPNIVSPAVMKVLRKGDHVQLWHFTNTAINEVKHNPNIFNEDTVEMVKSVDGSFTLAPTTSLKTSCSVIDDKDLEWEAYRTATMRMTKAMRDASWPEDRIRMFASFWGNLERHDLRLSADERDLKALLLYQDERRLLWHNSIRAGLPVFDISILDEGLITKCSDRVYREERDKKDRVYDQDVSPLCSPTSVQSHDFIL
jgi:hypothetical protein